MRLAPPSPAGHSAPAAVLTINVIFLARARFRSPSGYKLIDIAADMI